MVPWWTFVSLVVVLLFHVYTGAPASTWPSGNSLFSSKMLVDKVPSEHGR